MRCWSYAAVLLAVAAGGCRNPDTGFNADVDRELTEINSSLKLLAAKTAPDKIVLEPETEGEGIREIRALPDNPTDEEVATYAKAIFDAVKDRRRLSSDDEYARLVGLIPPGHIIMLSGYLGNFYFQNRIPEWVRPEDKDVILAKLPDEPGLLPCLFCVPVTPEEARPVLLEMLARNPFSVNTRTLRMFYPVLVDDPATREELIRIVMEQPNLFEVAEALDQYEGCGELIPKMWDYAADHQLELPSPLMVKATRQGSVKALGRLAWLVTKDPSRNEYYRNLLQEVAPALAAADDPEACYKANQSRIFFVPETKQFVIREENK